MTGPFMSLLSLLVFLIYLCPTTSYQITHIEKLQKTTCEAVYARALGSRKEMDFSKAIGNLSCSPGPKGFIKYHCLVNEDGHNIQFCAEWIWIESGLCPRLYSLQGIINPKECGGDDCPTDKYQSHMYYKYPPCLVKEQSKNRTAEPNTQSPKNESSDPTVAILVSLVFIIPVGVAAGIIIYIIWRRRRNGSKNRADTTEFPLLDTCKYDFCQTKPFEAMEECVKQGRHIVLTGLPGSGVSTLLEQMRNSHQGKKWHIEKHGELHFKSRNVQFIVFDQSGLLKLMLKHSQEDISVEVSQVQGETTVIIIVDYEWYTQSTEKLKQCLGEAHDIIDLSSKKYRLGSLEKRQYLDFLCEENDITEFDLPEEKRQVISAYKESSKGFPLLCSDLINSKKFDNPEAYLRMTDSRKENFRQTRPFRAMVECVKQKRHIVLTGLPGSGVTTLLDQLRDFHQGMMWHTEKHGKLHLKSRDAQFIVFYQSGLEELIKNHSFEDISMEMADVLGKTTVIIHVDYEWYTQSPDKIQRCLGKAYTVVDLSSEKYRLNNLEKRRYLDDLCEKNGITEDELPEEKRQVIASYRESSKGFLLLCSDLINSGNFGNPEAHLRMKDSRKGTTEKYLQRRAFEAMEDCINNMRHIVLTGKPGSGVSTLMEQIRDSHQGKKWHKEKHGELNFKSRDAEFVVFDHSGLQNVLTRYSAEDISKEMMQVLGTKTVIINIDYDWYTKFPEKIRQCLGKMYKVIDLSSEKYRLNKLEKREYLDFLCEKNGITEGTLPEEKRQAIASYKESNKGFLLLCLDLINRRAFDNPDAYLRMKDSKKDVLEQDRPLNAAKSKLDAGRHVLVTGLPGSGTSTFLEHLKRKCQNWEKVKYKTLRFNKKGKGVVEIDHDIVKDLMKSDELNKLKDRILDAPGCAFIMSVKYEWYRKYVDKFRGKLEIPFDVIDLSSDKYKLNNKEKLAIVDKLCSDKGISLEQLSNEKRQEISSFDGSYCGFLQVFKEFLKEKEFENPIKKMEEIDEQHKG